MIAVIVTMNFVITNESPLSFCSWSQPLENINMFMTKEGLLTCVRKATPLNFLRAANPSKALF